MQRFTYTINVLYYRKSRFLMRSPIFLLIPMYILGAASSTWMFIARALETGFYGSKT